MLESLEQANIKRMSVEAEKRPELMFDPERDFTVAQWETIKEDYVEALKDKPIRAAHILAHVTIMGEQNRLPALTREQMDGMLNDLYDKHKDQIMFAENLKIIDPTIQIFSSQLNWAKINQEMDRYKINSNNIDNLGAYLNRVVAVSIVEGKQAGVDRDHIERALSKESRSEFWDAQANLFAKIKLLFPEVDLGITDDDWVAMKDEMHLHTPSGMEQAWLGANLTILAAEDARLENGLIKIRMPEKKAEQDSVPEQRNF